MTQQELFDPKRAEEEKKRGMELAAKDKALSMEYAREVAREIATKRGGFCTADEVQEVLITQGIELGNAAGSIFKTKEWEFTGKYVPSRRVSNHASIRRVWRLKG